MYTPQSKHLSTNALNAKAGFRVNGSPKQLMSQTQQNFNDTNGDIKRATSERNFRIKKSNKKKSKKVEDSEKQVEI